MFDKDRFAEDCLAAVRADRSHKLVQQVVERALADPGALRAALGEAKAGALEPIFRSDELTILNVIWQPGMTATPHDHRTWAVIGVYQGARIISSGGGCPMRPTG